MGDSFLAVTFGFAFALFALGLYGIVARESLVRVLFGLVIMTKGVTLTFLAAGNARDQLGTAQAIVFTIIVIEVAVAALALAVMVNVHRTTGSLSVASIRRLQG
ncbi:MAG TPA: NADH-quinone oxidoreductase subunit K [Thermoplasmata archaeon]|nr:NADH-quinone oxidoreductase subunit K [Thermoplasmata archaeon]HLA46392.1 NADH-quinone oxidoreductase subunit K [Thermoplasmata archaeon]